MEGIYWVKIIIKICFCPGAVADVLELADFNISPLSCTDHVLFSLELSVVAPHCREEGSI